MKNLNNNKLVNRTKAFALKFAKLALLLLVAFAVEQFVGHLFAGLDFAFAEFALSEFGNSLAVKLLVKVLFLANHFTGKGKKSNKE